MGSKKVEHWDRAEIYALIQLWGDNYKELNEMKRKRPIFEKISLDLKEMGIFYDYTQVQRKLGWLKEQYTKKKPGPTGDSRPDWIFFDKVHQVLHESHYFNEENVDIVELGIRANGNNSSNVVENESQEIDEVNTEIPCSSSSTSGASGLSSTTQENIVEEKKISNSSKLAKARKRRLEKSKDTQEALLDFLKKGRENDEKVYEERSKKSDDFMERLVTSFERIANNRSQPQSSQQSWPQQYPPWGYMNTQYSGMTYGSAGGSPGGSSTTKSQSQHNQLMDD